MAWRIGRRGLGLGSRSSLPAWSVLFRGSSIGMTNILRRADWAERAVWGCREPGVRAAWTGGLGGQARINGASLVCSLSA